MGNHIYKRICYSQAMQHSQLFPCPQGQLSHHKKQSGQRAGFLYGNSMLAIPKHHLVPHDPGNGFQQYLLHTCPSKVRLSSLQYPRYSLPLLNMDVMFAFFFSSHQETPLIAMALQGWLKVDSHTDIRQRFQCPWMYPMRTNALVCVQCLKHASTVCTTSPFSSPLYLHLNVCISVMKDRKQEQTNRVFSTSKNKNVTTHS